MTADDALREPFSGLAPGDRVRDGIREGTVTLVGWDPPARSVPVVDVWWDGHTAPTRHRGAAVTYLERLTDLRSRAHAWGYRLARRWLRP